MRLSVRHILPVPPAEAWSALNDLAVLQQALPGCESLLEIAPDEFVGEMAVAPVGEAPDTTVILRAVAGSTCACRAAAWPQPRHPVRSRRIHVCVPGGGMAGSGWILRLRAG